MTDYLTLTEFVPGTKAKAQEVNANFSTLKDAINQKASTDGDSTQTFSVANATTVTHAVNKGQLNDLSTDLIGEINKTSTKFCVKSGHTSNGKSDLFSYSVLTITPKIGGVYDDLVISDYSGTQTTISSANTVSMSGKPNGEYNLFIKPDGTLYTLDNTIYKQAARPTMLDGDVWFDTSVEPFNCVKYNGTTDNEFLDIPLGAVTILSSAITAIKSFPFNQNGHNITAQSTLEIGTDLAASIPNLSMPDYANGVSKSWATSYQAESDGHLFAQSDFGLYVYLSFDNSTWVSYGIGRFDSQGYGVGSFVPIPKGIYYKAVCLTARNLNLVFYPCLAS